MKAIINSARLECSTRLNEGMCFVMDIGVLYHSSHKMYNGATFAQD